MENLSMAAINLKNGSLGLEEKLSDFLPKWRKSSFLLKISPDKSRAFQLKERLFGQFTGKMMGLFCSINIWKERIPTKV
jgi:hypothetical protein